MDSAAQQGPRRATVVSGLGVAQILAWGSTYYLLGVLAQPIVADTGWPLPLIIGGLSLGLLVSGLVARRVGRLIDHHGGRPVLSASALLLAAGLAGLAWAPAALAFLAAWLVIGLGMGCGLYEAAFSTLGRLYGREGRDAISMLTLWGGFAATVCWPLSAWLVEMVGWRGTCLAYAALHLGVTLPLYRLTLPRRPPPVPPISPPLPVTPLPTGASEALLLGLLAVILTGTAAIATMWSTHLLTILQGSGLALGAAVALGASVGPAQVASRVMERLIGRRFHPIRTLAAAALLIAAGLSALWIGVQPPLLPMLCYGAGLGIWSIARGTLPLALFGAEGYAVRMGKLATPSLLTAAAAPSLGALLIDTAGPEAAMTALAVVALANVLLVALLWQLARPVIASRTA
jgi:hypothetical protein